MLSNRSKYMSQRRQLPLKPLRNPSQAKSDHGLRVDYLDGTEIWERNHFWSDKHERMLATNWIEIDQSLISCMHLYWKGSHRVTLNQAELNPDKWLFSHTAVMSVGDGSNVAILTRNIGYDKDGARYWFRVDEKTGVLSYYVGTPK
jgi:hypothetical protein